MCNIAAPSLRTYPFARESNAKHLPLGDSMDALLNPTDACGVMIALAPPAKAVSQSPDQMFWQANVMATSDDEQAVSTARLGPLRSSKKETRFAAMHNTPPLFVCMSIFG